MSKLSPAEARRIHVALADLARRSDRPLWLLEGALATLVLNARIREGAK